MGKLQEEITKSRRLLQNPYAHLDGNGAYSALQKSDIPVETQLGKKIKESRQLLQDPYAYLNGAGGFSALPSHMHRVTPTEKNWYSNTEIEQKAQETHRLVWKNRERIWGAAIPVNPIDMLDPSFALELLGFDFGLEETLGFYLEKGQKIEVAGLIDKSTKQVRISRQFPQSIRMFTAAHELGHAVLHRGNGLHRDRPLDGVRRSRDAREFSADKFASYYLMPQKLVRDRFVSLFGTDNFILDEATVFALVQKGLPEFLHKHKNLRDLTRLLAGAEYYNGRRFVSLAKQFRVSEEAMAIRLEELELIAV